MRRVYLIRHGKPDFQTGTYCLGRTDMPLGPVGRMQSCLAAQALEDAGISTVFTSPLSRARETAAFFSAAPVVVPGLMEADMGLWDGLSFHTIREKYPELYARRGADMRVPIPGAEPPTAALARFEAAVRHCLSRSSGSIAIVAHAAVIKLLLAAMLNTALETSCEYHLPYCTTVQLAYDGGFRLLGTSALPQPALDRGVCLRLLRAAGTPAHVIAHCAAAADEARRIAGALRKSGASIQAALAENAAMLHDIARALPEHAMRGADWLSELGYTREADVVQRHHALDADADFEFITVCLADALTLGAERVSLARRFLESRKKCRDAEALRAHGFRRREAFRAARRINDLCGREVIHLNGSPT